MIRAVGRLCAVLCLCTVTYNDSLPILVPSAEQVASIDRYVKAEMRREHIPGLAVGVYSRRQILLVKGYGLANLELNVAVKPETLFQSGSVGKQFVSAAMMMLVEEGKIGLDDSIVKYFPNAPKNWEGIRVKNLLSHTSGLAEYESDERVGPKGPFYLRLDFTEDQLVEKVESLPIEFKAGDKWDYRNTNYLLLGVIIHKVTGPELAALLTPEVAQSLARSVQLIWPAESQTLVFRTEENGLTESRYRIGKKDQTRIVTFNLAKDAKVAAFWIRPDPDVR